MHLRTIANAAMPPPFRPAGFRIAYRRGITNHCPGCGHSQWFVGRSSAQCAFCETAVPFAASVQRAA